MRELKFNGNNIITGPGSIDWIGKIEAQRIFIITGKSAMFDNGTIAHLGDLLRVAGKEYEVYSGIGSNPTEEDVLKGAEALFAFGADAVVAVGGGSAIDAAKVMTLMCDQPGLTIEAIREGKAPDKRDHIQLIAVPSTSGTASEVTRAAVLTFSKEKIKVGLKTTAFIPDVAILDGNLTLSMPPHIMVETGMDALTHAIESYINRNNDDFCKTLSKGAVDGLIKYLPDSFDEGDIESRQHVHNFQCYAGLAFQNSGLGMSHGIAHAFGGRYGTSHGLLNAIALPYVMKYNARSPEVAEDLRELSQMIGQDITKMVEQLNAHFGLPECFRDIDIDERMFENDFEELLENSMKGSTVRNPVAMTEDEMEKVLKSIYYGRIIF